MRISKLLIGSMAALAMCAGISIAEAGTVRLCTGAADGNYAAVGDMIAKYATGDTKIVVVKDTGGSWGNVQRTMIKDPADAEACDAFIAQPDALAVLKQGYHTDQGGTIGANSAAAAKVLKVGDLYREYLHVLCNKDSKVTDLHSIRGTKDKIAVGGEGSGGWLIWQNIIYQNSDYASLIDQPLGGTEASAAAANGDVTCALFPAGIDNGAVVEANDLFGDKLVLAVANDRAFVKSVDAQGKPLYEYSKIDGSHYPKLVAGYWSSGVDTISWQASAYINLDRVAKVDRVALIRMVGKAHKEASAAYGD